MAQVIVSGIKALGKKYLIIENAIVDDSGHIHINGDAASADLVLSALNKHRKIFAPTVGQTSFVLDELPIPDSVVDMYVNGHHQVALNHYTVDYATGTVTWLNVGYSMSDTDHVEIFYNKVP